MVGVELRRTNQQPLSLQRTGEVLFRQGRPLIRTFGFVADHRDRALEAAATQCVHGLCGRLPGSDHDDVSYHGSSTKAERAWRGAALKRRGQGRCESCKNAQACVT